MRHAFVVNRMLAWYRALVRLRRSLPGFAGGEPWATRVHCDEQEGWLVLERPGVLVAVNLAERPVKVDLGDERARLVLARVP